MQLCLLDGSYSVGAAPPIRPETHLDFHIRATGDGLYIPMDFLVCFPCSVLAYRGKGNDHLFHLGLEEWVSIDFESDVWL